MKSLGSTTTFEIGDWRLCFKIVLRDYDPLERQTEINLEYTIVEVNAELGGGGGRQNEADLGGGGENQADLGGRGEDEAKLGGGGEDEADLGGESEDEVVLGSGCQTEGEFGGRGEPDLRGGGEDEFGGGGEADLGGGGGQEGVFETEVYIKAEVHSWDDSENENEDFVNIPVSVMGDINNCDNDVGSMVDEIRRPT
ncbi:hypothetical protein DEO72_LG5g832 [Vigna unguiculata]|uniref:Uncharacterized protein n=1 Tax=Vigna unguiculata TaxID=3917 RepID=A0A4D6LWC0_VIGUN|nr:hypothetical protein DEO72_LG5g832 [Vigna unguiculata]